MTLRTILVIALRFYAINLSTSVLPLLPTLILFLNYRGPGSVVPWMALCAPLAYVMVAVLLWFAAGRLATGIAREINPAIQFQITLEEAFSFAFVFLGLYFILNSLAWTLINLFYLPGIMGPTTHGAATQTRAGNDLWRPGITLAAGLVSVFCSKVWARKLANRGMKAGEI